MTLPVAILAGGLAMRLRPITESIPKALVRVAGRPFIDHQLALLRSNGYRKIVLCLGYRGDMVQAHVGDGTRWSMHIDCVFDGPQLLGTGGALRRALPFLGGEFFVLYGDSYLPCPYADVEAAFHRSALPALMTVHRNEGRWGASNAVYADGRVRSYDKRRQSASQRHIDYGLGAFHKSVLAAYSENEAFDLADVYSQLAAEGRLAGYEIGERFYEVGSPEGLADADRYLSTHSLAETLE